jgi:hypothetical protein
MRKEPRSPSKKKPFAPEDSRRGRSPLSEGYDKKLDGPDQPSV